MESSRSEMLFYSWRKLDLKISGGNSLAERCSHTLSRVGSQIYLIGGGKISDPNIGFEHYNEVWRLDVSAGIAEEVEVTGTFTPRRGHSAVVYQDRYIIVFGGIGGSVSADPSDITQGMTNDLFLFNTLTNSWSQLPTISINNREDRNGDVVVEMCPSPRRGHAAAIYGNKMYIVGGDCHDMNDIFRVFTLDLNFLFWESHQVFGSAPLGLSLSSYEQVENHLIFFSGTTLNMSARDQILSQVRVLNLDTFEWRDLTHVLDWSAYNPHASRGSIHRHPPARFCCSSALLCDGKLMLVFGGTKLGSASGGTGTDRSYVDDLLAFDPSSLLTGGAESLPGYDLHRSQQQQQKRQNNHQQSKVKQKLKYFAHHTDLPATATATATESIRLSSQGGDIGQERPAARNGMAMVTYAENSCIMFGGGVYPSLYFNDIWVLDFFIMPKVVSPRSLGSYYPPRIASTSAMDRSLIRGAGDGTGGISAADQHHHLPHRNSSHEGRGAVTTTTRSRSRPSDGEASVSAAMFRYFASLLDDRRFADIAFLVGNSGANILSDQYANYSSPTATATATVTRKSNSRVVLAHRVVLCAQSAYFRSMLDGSFAETASSSTSAASSGATLSDEESSLPAGVVKIRLEDINADSLEYLLRFLYCNELPPRALASADSIWDLLHCANMLGVSEVKAACEETLCSAMDLYNGIDEGILCRPSWVASSPSATTTSTTAVLEGMTTVVGGDDRGDPKNGGGGEHMREGGGGGPVAACNNSSSSSSSTTSTASRDARTNRRTQSRVRNSTPAKEFSEEEVQEIMVIVQILAAAEFYSCSQLIHHCIHFLRLRRLLVLTLRSPESGSSASASGPKSGPSASMSWPESGPTASGSAIARRAGLAATVRVRNRMITRVEAREGGGGDGASSRAREEASMQQMTQEEGQYHHDDSAAAAVGGGSTGRNGGGGSHRDNCNNDDADNQEDDTDANNDDEDEAFDDDNDNTDDPSSNSKQQHNTTAENMRTTTTRSSSLPPVLLSESVQELLDEAKQALSSELFEKLYLVLIDSDNRALNYCI